MKQAFLCVSFGTSVPAARKNITAVEEALKAERPDMDFYRAFTSPTIRRHLAARGETIWDVPEALDRLAEKGYRQVLIQPTHFLYGLEYEALCAKVEEKRALFSSVLLGKPLLAHTEDLRALSQILSEAYPQKPGESLVLMGHGTPHFSNVVYPALQAVFPFAEADVAESLFYDGFRPDCFAEYARGFVCACERACYDCGYSRIFELRR